MTVQSRPGPKKIFREPFPRRSTTQTRHRINGDDETGSFKMRCKLDTVIVSAAGNSVARSGCLSLPRSQTERN
ncbi:hypothetical protein OH77DRAFT_832504 [Trametes cingulata]|nr:hypothetical protein OH77DRAFT_832504 [Trametes cingulata]